MNYTVNVELARGNEKFKLEFNRDDDYIEYEVLTDDDIFNMPFVEPADEAEKRIGEIVSQFLTESKERFTYET